MTAAGWAVTLIVIAALLVLDWLVRGRRPHAVGFGEAARWSAFFVAVALLFGVVLGAVAGWDFGAQYFAGYAVEKSLSVDNLFVFLIIISTFAVPAAQQPKALTIGIAMALGLRAIFIALGVALLNAFSFMFLLFGLALIATAMQLYRHRDEDPSVEDNVLVGFARRVLPVTDRYHGGRIVTRVEGARMFTPILLVLVAIGSTDLLFAFDSIPAVFGITQSGYIVFAANAFALLGLRPLFFLVSSLLDRLVYLSVALAVILAFIGVKLVLHFAHLHDQSVPEISTGASLAVVVVVIAVATAASFARVRREPGLRAHAGALRHHPRESARRSDAP